MAGKRSRTSKQQSPAKGKKAGPKKELLSTNDFLSKGLDTDSEDEMEEDRSEEKEDDSSDSDNEPVSLSKHKRSLEKLKKADPAFYKFLEKEDKDLLNVDVSDDEDDDDEDDVDDEDDEDDSEDEGSGKENGKKGRLHKLPAKLEVASDDSDVEDSDRDEPAAKVKTKKLKVTVVTPKMIALWTKSLQANNSVVAMQNTMFAFKAAVQEASSDDTTTCRYKVEGSAVFNSIVRLCLTELLPSFHRFLNLPKRKEYQKPLLPSSSPRWKKIRLIIKSYLTDTLQLLSNLGDPVVLNTILKHVSQLTSFYVCFPKLARALLKKCISLWSSGDETSRVLAFLILNRITRLMQDRLLDFTLKQMYMAYVKNCKFTSPSLLPMINFMQRTLVEMLAIDVEKAYQYAFVYIRQLAIHLRNAITLKKKENCQAVYNWQYMHSLHFWARFLSELHQSEVLAPLVYPLTQVIIGTIKLVPTARYYPLRFHCVRTLNLLCSSTGVYIPVLPILLEVFEVTDFNKRHNAVSFKPLNFAVILKLTKTQLQEKAFRDGVIDQLYEHFLETVHIHAHTVGFPELVLPAILQLKQFLKQCKVANYTKQIKQILEKIEINSKVITQRRRSASFNISDSKAVEVWEVRSKEEGTPIGKYYSTWRKLRDRELQHEIAGKERISTDDLPTIDRVRGPRKATEEDRKEFADLFDTDSEDEGDEKRFLPKNERRKKKQKTTDDDEVESSDFSDFDSDDLEKLAGSASDENEKDEEDDSDDEEEDSDDEESDDHSDTEEEEEEEREKKRPKRTTKIEESEEDQEDIVEDFKFSDDNEDD